MSKIESEQGSFRDRTGRVFYRDGAVFRCLTQRAADNWERLSRTRFFTELSAKGQLVATRRLDEIPSELPDGGPWAAVLAHERVPFVSYPYEWSFGMLRDAALLQLDLLAVALAENMILKDCSAYNVQWRGPRPIFIDIPTFQPLVMGEPWVGYQQFCKMFLYPLMLQAYRGTRFQPWLRGSIEGIEPAYMARLFGLFDLLHPGVLSHVFLHARLQKSSFWQKQNTRQRLQESGFSAKLIKANVRRLRRLIERLSWYPSTSTWLGYAEEHSYDSGEFEKKKEFVRRAVEKRQWRLVWDLGGNIGGFARIVARHADYIVVMDGDDVAVERLYLDLKREGGENILPLCIDLANPSPALGWRGLERKTLPERGRPDLVLALALIHHIVIGANIPLAEFVDWLAHLGSAIVVEFVTRQDDMVRQLLRNKEDQYSDYDLQNFEYCLSRHFAVLDRAPLKGGMRMIYFAVPV